MSVTVPASSCTTAAIATPSVFGAEVLSITANVVSNYSREVSDQYYYNHPSISVQGIDFCNITVTYTHPGQNDTLNVESWLPLKGWNGRLQAIGGGGYIAGRFFLSYIGMAGALGEGYAATTLDSGLPPSAYTPDEWAQISPGNVDLYTLQNFASVSLNDQAIISKSLVENFYGEPPKYSYWSGCSQGGRQGLMLAQRYPDAYDGIAAAAPAINWGEFIPSASWAQAMMNVLGHFPYPCEFDALTAAAVAECDPLDGITDGLISDSGAVACHFDAFRLVGTTINCTQTGANMKISEAAATIANLTWTGPTTADGGRRLWYGPDYQSRLTGALNMTKTTSDLGYAMTSCSANGTCVGLDTGLGEAWLKYWVTKDPAFTMADIKSQQEFSELFQASVQQFNSIIGTADPDLSALRNAGGKIITYHGLADGLIPVKGTTDYYNKATDVTPNIHDFYRYFKVPGLAHCSGGDGGQPTAVFQALVDWVENGISPDVLPISFQDKKGVQNDRILCPYPHVARLKSDGGDVTKADSFECVDITSTALKG